MAQDWYFDLSRTCIAHPGAKLIEARDSGLSLSLGGRTIMLDHDSKVANRAVVWSLISLPHAMSVRDLARAMRSYTAVQMGSGFVAGIAPGGEPLLGRNFDRVVLQTTSAGAMLDALLREAATFEQVLAGGSLPPAHRPAASDRVIDGSFEVYARKALKVIGADLPAKPTDFVRLGFEGGRQVGVHYLSAGSQLMLETGFSVGTVVDAVLAEYTAFELFNGGYALIAPPESGLISLVQLTPMAAVPAEDLVDSMQALAEREERVEAWYQKRVQELAALGAAPAESADPADAEAARRHLAAFTDVHARMQPVLEQATWAFDSAVVDVVGRNAQLSRALRRPGAVSPASRAYAQAQAELFATLMKNPEPPDRPEGAPDQNIYTGEKVGVSAPNIKEERGEAPVTALEKKAYFFARLHDFDAAPAPHQRSIPDLRIAKISRDASGRPSLVTFLDLQEASQDGPSLYVVPLYIVKRDAVPDATGAPAVQFNKVYFELDDAQGTYCMTALEDYDRECKLLNMFVRPTASWSIAQADQLPAFDLVRFPELRDRPEYPHVEAANWCELAKQQLTVLERVPAPPPPPPPRG